MTSKNTLRTIFLGVAFLLSGCAASPAQSRAPEQNDLPRDLPIPQEFQDQVRKSCAIGAQLYLLDKVAAIGTDVALANVGDLQAKGLGGYLPMREGDDDGTPRNSYLVVFFTDETPPRIAYEIRVAPDVKPDFESFNPPKTATPSLAALIRARQIAVSAMPPSTQPINPVIVPGEANEEHGMLVYLLAGTEKRNVAVFGRHFRALVPLGGTNVTYMMPLSNTALELPIKGPNGEKAVSLMVNHVVTDFPLETHVFTSLLLKMPVFVRTSRGLWRVDGDTIAFVKKEASNSKE